MSKPAWKREKIADLIARCLEVLEEAEHGSNQISHMECAPACSEWCNDNDPWGDGYMPYEFFRGAPICRDDEDALAAYLFGDWPTTAQETTHAAN